jgi:DNA polymerase elongation subunit (family B)
MSFKKRRLFFDIEVSPNVGLFWEAGWKKSIFHDSIIQERKIICISWKWEGDPTVYNVQWDKNKDDKKLLETFSKVLQHADESIAHNIKRFDMPWVRTRCLIHKIPIPFDVPMIDTLTVARGVFKLNSNKLDYIAKLLGCEGKIKTEYSMWKELTTLPYSNKKAKKALKEMTFYCDEDVRQLEKTFFRLIPYSKHTTHYAVLNGYDKWQCPECGSEKVRMKANRVTAAGTQRKQMACECGRYYNISIKVYQDYLQHKIDNTHTSKWVKN